MTKIQRLKARREAEKMREEALIKTIKMLPYMLIGYGLLWIILAM